MGLTMTTKTSLRLITPPASLPVTLQAAKAWLRVDHPDEDATVSALIAAATSALDGRGGILGRALEPQTWELALDAFPASEIRLPLGPVASVTSVAFTAADGSEGTVSASDFVIDNAETFGGWIVPRAGFAWPATMATGSAVRVRFVAGTGTPEAVRHGILAMVANRFDTREGGKLLTPGIVADLAPFRRPVVA